jgi:electron transport complex protein RnfC
VAEGGIVGLGGAAFPSQVKLSPPAEKPIDTVILNGCECEPYLTCDHRLMLERAEDALFGLKAIMRAVEAHRAFIGIEDNKPDAIQLMQEICAGEENIEVVVLKTKYPQGGEKMLIEAVLHREVPLGGLPMDVGALVHNVGTAVAIAECLNTGKPLIERVVTVVGNGVKEPANVLVPIGTALKEVIEACGGLSERAAQVILGGPMMGFAQATLDTPVVKGTCGILVLERDQVLPFEETPCIRCGRCVDVCPVFIVPADLARFAKAGDVGRLTEYDVMNCCECGCCAYVCPARIPLVHLLRLGKQLVQAAAKKS